MESDGSEAALKQEYLRTHIVEAGYDQDKFLQFMQLRKDNFENLELWSMKELQALVLEFTQLQKPGLEEQDFQLIDVLAGNQQPTVATPSKAKVVYRRSAQTDSPFAKLIDCAKLGQPLVRKILAQDYQLKTYGGYMFGLGATKEVAWRIRVPELKLQLERRNSDLKWLRNSLSRSYQHLLIPPLKLYKFKADPQSKEKRIHLLNIFFMELLAKPQLSSSRPLKTFLEQDRTKFEAEKKSIDELKVIKKVDITQNSGGVAKVTISNQVFDQISEYQALLDKNQPLLVEVKRLLKVVKEDFNRLAVTIDLLQKQFSGIKNNYQAFANTLGDEALSKQAVQLVEGIEDWLGSWGKQQQGMGEIMISRFQLMLKLNRRQKTAFGELSSRRKECQDFYLSYRQKLQAKKEKAFSSRNLDLWELAKSEITELLKRHPDVFQNKEEAFKHMFYKESVLLNQVRDWFGFMNERVRRESRQQLGQMSSRLRREVIALSDALQMALLGELENARQLKLIGQ